MQAQRVNRSLMTNTGMESSLGASRRKSKSAGTVVISTLPTPGSSTMLSAHSTTWHAMWTPVSAWQVRADLFLPLLCCGRVMRVTLTMGSAPPQTRHPLRLKCAVPAFFNFKPALFHLRVTFLHFVRHLFRCWTSGSCGSRGRIAASQNPVFLASPLPLRRCDVCGRYGVRSNKSIFILVIFFFHKYLMRGASERSVKTCCQLWEGSDTPPVLQESPHFRSEQNQQQIDTLIVQARRQYHHRNTCQMGTAYHARHCCHLPLRIPRVLASLQTPRPGTRNAERNQKKHTGDHNI